MTYDEIAQRRYDALRMSMRETVKEVEKQIAEYLNKEFNSQEKQMFKIYSFGKRFNNKSFATYEQARQYIRRWTTKQGGARIDNIGALGFSITK